MQPYGIIFLKKASPKFKVATIISWAREKLSSLKLKDWNSILLASYGNMHRFFPQTFSM